MANSTTIDRILLTGVPGIGKTTLICKVCDTLREKNVPIKGFYTKEIRNSCNLRIGFDVVTLDGKIGRLARSKNILAPNEISKYNVGNYAVFINEFESLVLPLLRQQDANAVFIVDEIGKMELFSDSFKKSVGDLFAKRNIKILATIPVPRAKPNHFIEKLKNDPCNLVITVNKSNRDELLQKILTLLNING